MKKALGIVLILLLAGSATAAEYWHLGVGFRGTAVVLRDDIDNTFGWGMMVTLGDPDSRFTTQMEVDSWKSVYTIAGFENHYSGFGAGFFEKYRVFDFTPNLSSYLIGGFGGYFLELKEEEDIEFVGIELRSKYINSYFMLAGGLGFDYRISPKLAVYTEGRYVDYPKRWSSGDEFLDNSLLNGYLGARYSF